jgi:trans-aconitate methyltransferase
MTSSLPDAYFEAMYRSDADPWRFATSDYERDKYVATSASLGDGPISRAFEVGCSIGVFTRSLAARCQRLLAVDVSHTALEQARQRCADLPNVELDYRRIPQDWPTEQKFDLILFSEVLYFLCPADIATTARHSVASLTPHGRIVLVNWTGPTDYPCSGDAAADQFIADCPSLRISLQDRRPQYRLDVLQRAD